MSSWSNDQYMMPNMMGINPLMSNMMPPMYGPPPGAPVPYGVPPPTSNPGKGDEKPKEQNRDPRIDNKDYAKQRDLVPKRTNQQDNDHNNKSDRNKGTKKSKWDSGGNTKDWPAQQPNNPPNPPLPGAGIYGPGPNNMMMPPNMMPYGPPGPMMPPMDMAGMPNMPGAIPNMPPMPNMTPMPNMMPGMNMMMMNQAMPSADNQAIYVGNAALLPPLPNVSLPMRSEKPPGCKSIFIGGFPSNVTKEIINEMFIRFGMITDIKLSKQGVAQVRFDNPDSVEQAFFFSGSRFRFMDQLDTEASTLFIDYAPNSDDHFEHDKYRPSSPPRFEPCTPDALNNLAEKMKSETEFSEVAHTLEGWLQRGDCNKKNGNSFYNLIQLANNHLRRLYDEKMKIDEDYQRMKITLKEKFTGLLKQLELVAKILTAAKNHRVLDCFSRQQRKNVEMWLKMTEEVTTIREEFNSMFDEEDGEHGSKKTISIEKYEELKKENEKLNVQVEGYMNEIHLAKEEADKKIETLKSQYAMQLMTAQIYPPLPPTPKMVEPPAKPEPPSDEYSTSGQSVPTSEAKIISVITSFLVIHPNGAVADQIVPYVKIMCPFVTLGTVNHILQKYSDVFMRKKHGRGVNTEYRWFYAMFERLRNEFK